MPFTHLLLLSGKAELCRSWSWDVPGKIAVCGDLASGKRRLFEFLDVFRNRGLLPVDEVEEAIVAAHEALDGRDSGWVLVEPGEILTLYAMDENDDLEELNRAEVFDQIPGVRFRPAR